MAEEVKSFGVTVVIFQCSIAGMRIEEPET